VIAQAQRMRLLKTMQALWNRCDKWLCERWLPLGLAVLLSGFFWAPTTHNHKVMVSCLLLLPCLIALVDRALWRDLVPKAPLLAMTFTYLAYMTANALIQSGDRGEEFIRWSLCIMLFLLGIGLRMRASLRSLEQLFLLSAFAAVTAAAYAVYRDIGAGIFLTFHYRLEGYGALYNALRSGLLFGAFAATAMWCAFSRDCARWQRYAAVILALGCLGAVVLTGSRAPLLALLILAVAIAVTYRRWWVLALIVAGCVVVEALAWDALLDRGTSYRPEIWRQVWALYRESPIFGVGLQRHPVSVTAGGVTVFNEHNLFLALLRQGGVVGFVLYLSVALTVCVQGWRWRSICRIGFLAAILQIYGLISLQADGPRLITRPADVWVVLWLPIALLLFSQRNCRARSDGAAVAAH